MPKKILIFTTSIAGGGAERNAALLSQYLDANVTLAVYESRPDSFPHGGTFIDLQFTPSRHLWSKLISYIRRLKELRRLKMEGEIDLTISLLDQPNLMNLLSHSHGQSVISIRNFTSLKSQESMGVARRLESWLLTRLYNRADKVVAVSREMQRDLAENYHVRKDKLAVIYNGCDLAAIANAPGDLDTMLEEYFKNPTIVTFGKLYPQKGQWHLIRSFKQIKSKVPDARLVIGGRGPLFDYLNRLAEGLSLTTARLDSDGGEMSLPGADVLFLGYQPNPFRFLKNASVFALPSLYEGFPNILLEAMACRLPIVASDCRSGPREILAPDVPLEKSITYAFRSEYGILLPTLDTKQYSSGHDLTAEEKVWAESITELLLDEKLRVHYRRKSIERVTDFDIKNTINQWSDLIEAVVHQPA